MATQHHTAARSGFLGAVTLDRIIIFLCAPAAWGLVMAVAALVGEG